MPQETIQYPAAYVAVGAYRLAHDPSLWKPMWADIQGAAKKASIAATAWAVLTWPIQRGFVGLFMKGSGKVLGFSSMYTSVAETADRIDDSLPFRIPLPSLQGFATFMFVLSQCSTIIELWLRNRLKRARSQAYGETVRSRGKSADWWTDYYEEWEVPPTERAMQASKRQAFYTRMATPVIRMVIIKLLLLPLDWVPFLTLGISAFIRSLSMGRQLHAPLFAAKRMTPVQVEVWMMERQWMYRQFGFLAALVENIPLAGIAFSISNRVGAAMYAHDLEKRQQMFRRGQVAKLKPNETYRGDGSDEDSSSNSKKSPWRPSGPGAKPPVGRVGDTDVPGDFASDSTLDQADEQARRYPSIPRPVEKDDDLPAYTANEAEKVIGGSASAAGGLGIAPGHAAPTSTKRRVPPPPPS